MASTLKIISGRYRLPHNGESEVKIPGCGEIGRNPLISSFKNVKNY